MFYDGCPSGLPIMYPGTKTPVTCSGKRRCPPGYYCARSRQSKQFICCTIYYLFDDDHSKSTVLNLRPQLLLSCFNISETNCSMRRLFSYERKLYGIVTVFVYFCKELPRVEEKAEKISLFSLKIWTTEKKIYLHSSFFNRYERVIRNFNTEKQQTLMI